LNYNYWDWGKYEVLDEFEKNLPLLMKNHKIIIYQPYSNNFLSKIFLVFALGFSIIQVISTEISIRIY